MAEPLLPWLTEPGLLTERVRACCASGLRLNLLRITSAPLEPGLAEFGGNDLGEALTGLAEVQREPLEYVELEATHDLALAATHDVAGVARLWARRKVYRLAGGPILLQEVFLPVLCAQ